MSEGRDGVERLAARAKAALRKTSSGPERSARAAVAVILCPRGDDADVLFIRRPKRDGDRWSGDVAFPGGMSQPGEDAAETAAREASEEVGLALGAPVGALADRTTARPGERLRFRWSFRAPGAVRTWLAELARMEPTMRVRPFVFVAPRAPLVLDPREVEEAFFVPLSRLRRLPLVPTVRRINGVSLPFPALDLDGRALWGLTLSMVLELRKLAL